MTPPTIARFIARQYGLSPGALGVSVAPLEPGLECAVVRVRIVTQDGRVPTRLVVKHLRGRHRREVDVYAHVHSSLPAAPIAGVHGVDIRDDASYLYLEDLDTADPWPWSDPRLAAEVCRVLACLHRSAAAAASGVDNWDYETHLAESARSTLGLARAARDADGRLVWRRRGDLERVVRCLPRIRARLASEGRVLIHGDVHPGNVMVIKGGGQGRVRLIDWAHARYGCPFEDIASWLHSLGCWEAEARRRHDSLLGAYLRTLDPGRRLCHATRMTYWLAAACNGLSGAIRYHLAVLGDRASREEHRSASNAALHEWERVIRRAALLLGSAA